MTMMTSRGNCRTTRASLVLNESVRCRFLLAVVAATAIVGLLGERLSARETPPATALTELDRYVAAADDSFAWQIVDRRDDDQATTLLVDLTSQTWRNEDEVDRTVWQHWLWIVVPRAATSDTGLLVISGGANGGEPPQKPAAMLREIALATNSVVAEVGQVPNQPLEFFGDGEPRYEDNLLARSWQAALKAHDPSWPGQLPMTKSAVRAMDAVKAALATDPQLAQVDRFVVTGGSKRGWTTWLTAAVDDRVVAIAPVVIDMLNIRESMRNHHEAYGFWAPAIGDYERAGLMDRMDDDAMTPLLNIVDPYSYRERMTMPKCIINASGDQFFTPDSSQFYFAALPGEKLLAYVPNADHSLRNSNALETLTAFYASVVDGRPRPEVEWELAGETGWRVSCDPPPTRALLWHAVNPEARDFRLDKVGPIYKSRELSPDGDGKYSGVVARPKEGFAAVFVQLECDIGAGVPLRVTTPVTIISAGSGAATSSGGVAGGE